MNTAITKPKAYSYVRMSTPEQLLGDSLRRQTDRAKLWAAQQGFEIDDTLTFHDLGVSGFRGRNAETGALRAFLDAVEDGAVPKGSYLIVESLDRVSRQVPRRAARTLERIVEAGVNLVDLEDGGRIYNTDTLDGDDMAYLMMVVRFMRANQESAIKSARLSSVYEKKRKDAATRQNTDKPFTRQLPAWLRWNEQTRAHELIPERAAIVQSIFEKAAQGWGQHKIARWLNDQGTRTWGDATQWHRSYVKKVLSNSAVIGTFTPHRRLVDDKGRRQRKPLEAIESYFPTVVEREVFERVALRLATTSPRGRHANRELRSMFAGVLKCEHCGGSVSRVSKGKHVYLVCAKANSRTGACQYRTIPYGDVEEHFRKRSAEFLDEAPRGRDTEEIEDQIARTTANIDGLEDAARDVADEIGNTRSPAGAMGESW